MARTHRVCHGHEMANATQPIRCAVHLSHADRGIEAEIDIRTVRHPSETTERVWLRILALLWQWQEGLEHAGDVSSPEGPELAARDLTGETVCAVWVGKPDVRRVQRGVDAAPKARAAVLFESPMRLREFRSEAEGMHRLSRLDLAAVDPELLRRLSTLDLKRAKLSLTISGDHLYVEAAGQPFDGPLLRE